MRHNARKRNTRRKEVSKVKFIATFNPALPGIEGLIKKHIHYLHSDEVLKNVPRLALKVIVLLLVVTNVTFVRTS